MRNEIVLRGRVVSVRDTMKATQVFDPLEIIGDGLLTSRPHNPKVACSNHAPAT